MTLFAPAGAALPRSDRLVTLPTHQRAQQGTSASISQPSDLEPAEGVILGAVLGMILWAVLLALVWAFTAI